jgi:hypothetical protein
MLIVVMMGLGGAACDLALFHSYEVSIGTAAALHRSAGAVADQVVGLIHDSEASLGRTLAPIRIIRVTAIDSNRVAEVEPGAGVEVGPPPTTVWVVRAEGTFTSNRPRNGPISAASGYYVISDKDGSVIGFGFP